MSEFKLSLDKDKKYLLALSGGADSVCLFHLLKSANYSFAAAHVNHGIRGDEADRDEQFCRKLCEDSGVKLFCLKADVPKIARKSGESLEEAARRVRYDFFASLLPLGGPFTLLTAHNADDNAETLLLALTRGCSPSGACGISRSRVLKDNFEVQRPLLPYSKEEIVSFCNKNGYSFVTDSTNADVAYPRNRIRHNILPELSAINPAFLEAFTRFTEAQRSDCEYLDAEAEKYSWKLEAATLAALPRPIATRAIAAAAYRAGAKPEAVHIEGMLEIARNGGGSLSLPGGIIAALEQGEIRFHPECREKKKRSDVYPYIDPKVLVEGDICFGSGKIRLSIGELTNDSAQVYNLSTSAKINLDRIKKQLYVRSRHSGDRIVIGGIHRSVKKMLSDKLSHLPLEERRALPVICDGEEIVWVPGLEVADDYKGTTATVYYLSEAKNEADT